MTHRPASPRRGVLPVVVALVVTVGVPGCRRSIETASVSGRIVLDGQPVANGTIAFLPTDGKGPTAGAVVADGAYEVARLAPGPKIVRIEAFREQVAFPRSRAEMERTAGDPRPPKPTEPPPDPNLIPRDAAGNNVEVTIAPGRQSMDFEVTGSGGR